MSEKPQKPATSGPSRRKPVRGKRADVESLRAKAAVLFAEGLAAKAVAEKLGITERRARQFKSDVAAPLRAAAETRIDAVVEAANESRREIAKRASMFVSTLVDAAQGKLRVALTTYEREQLGGAEVPFERDPQMVNARTRAAVAALGFILATKADVSVSPGDDTKGFLAQVAVFAREMTAPKIVG